MKNVIVALPLLALGFACTPQNSAGSPEGAVTAIYETLVKSKGQETTPITAIRMTADLEALARQAEAAAGDGAPVFDGDLAGNCQDCTDFANLKVERPASSTAAEGHTIIEARFKLFQNEPKNVQWDLVETPDGWRVDNIVSDGFNVRKIANEVIAAAATAPPGPDGDEAVECLTFIRLAVDAMAQAKPPGDTAALSAAGAAWRKRAEGIYTADGLAKYLASSLAVLGDTPGDAFRAKASDCAAKAPTAP
jgi:hypothetical protein